MENLGTLRTPVKFNNGKIQLVKVTLVGDAFRSILGRDLFYQLWKTIMQKLGHNFEYKKIDHQCTIKKSIAKDFPELIT